jgi:hypothetical protein
VKDRGKEERKVRIGREEEREGRRSLKVGYSGRRRERVRRANRGFF